MENRERTAIGIFLTGVLFLGCNSIADGGADVKKMPKRPIEAVLKEHTSRLMALPGVIGTAQGECSGSTCIRVYVAAKSPEIIGQIPSEIEGYPVVTEETGEIRPLNER